MQKIKNHFKKVDPLLYATIKGNSWHTLKRRKFTKFSGLCRIVAGQQLSTKAAHSIFTKFCTLFPNNKPTPERVLELTLEKLRACGLSNAKCSSIHCLALSTLNGSLPLQRFSKLSNEEVTEFLTQIRGIGPWSAEMFLMFTLGREDIFSSGDLGLRNAIKKLDNRKNLPSPEEATKRALKWSPYRTYACAILWNSLDNDPAK